MHRWTATATALLNFFNASMTRRNGGGCRASPLHFVFNNFTIGNPDFGAINAPSDGEMIFHWVRSSAPRV